MKSDLEQKVYDIFDHLAISYERFEHPPVYTVEEAKQFWQGIKGAHSKNLFLRNNKGNRHYLVVLEESKSADLKGLSDMLGAGKLSFASERRLMDHLGLEKGAVSPLGLINDSQNAVDGLLQIIIDSHILKKMCHVDFFFCLLEPFLDNTLTFCPAFSQSSLQLRKSRRKQKQSYGLRIVLHNR